MVLDIVNENNELLTKKDYYHPFELVENPNVLVIERCFFKNDNQVMYNSPFFYIPEEDFYLDPFHNKYAFKHDKKYDIEVQGFYEGLIINKNEVIVKLTGDEKKIIENFFIVSYKDYSFKFEVIETREELKEKYSCLFKIKMYKGDELLHEVTLSKDHFDSIHVLKVGSTALRYDEKDRIIPNEGKLFNILEAYVEIEELAELHLDKEVIDEELWDGEHQVKRLNIYVSKNVKSICDRAIFDYNHTAIEIYYDGTIEEWHKIKKGEMEYSYSEEWVDYQHFKSIEHRSEIYNNFISTNSKVLIHCSDGDIFDDKEINKKNCN